MPYCLPTDSADEAKRFRKVDLDKLPKTLPRSTNRYVPAIFGIVLSSSEFFSGRPAIRSLCNCLRRPTKAGGNETVLQNLIEPLHFCSRLFTKDRESGSCFVERPWCAPSPKASHIQRNSPLDRLGWSIRRPKIPGRVHVPVVGRPTVRADPLRTARYAYSAVGDRQTDELAKYRRQHGSSPSMST